MKNSIIIKQHIIYKALFLTALLLCSIGIMHEILSPYLKLFFIYGAGIFIYDFVKGRRVLRDKSIWIFGAFVLLYLATCLINADEFLLSNLKGLAYMGLFVLTLYPVCGDEEDVIAEGRIMAKAVLIMLFIISLACIVTYYVADSFVYETSDGVYGYVGELDGRMCGLVYFNTGGAIYALMVLLAIGILVAGQCGTIMKVFAASSAVLGIWCSCLAYSRTALAAGIFTLAAGVIVLGPGAKHKKIQTAFAIICCAALLIIAVSCFVIGEPAFEYLNDIFTGRVKIWQEGLRVFSEHPIFGAGYEGLTDMLNLPGMSGWEGGGLHSLYVSVLAASGVAGAAALLIFSIYNFRACRVLFKKADKETTIAALLILFVLIMEIAETRLLYRAGFFAALFWLLLGYVKVRANAYCKIKDDI